MITAYTLARWEVKAGQEDEFVRRWRDELGAFFLKIAPHGHGTLIRSVDEPRVFYSFGPWKSVDEIEAMRAHPQTIEVMRRVIELCDEATPGTYELVLEVSGSSG